MNATWDPELLGLELEALAAEDFPLEIHTGTFQMDRVDLEISSGKKCETA